MPAITTRVLVAGHDSDLSNGVIAVLAATRHIAGIGAAIEAVVDEHIL